MHSAMARLVEALDDGVQDPAVVTWACPVPFFGRINEARVATVGINPSNREFVAPDGSELDGGQRRLPTLASLALSDWSQATGADVHAVTQACLRYFDGNPYRLWFDVLERVLNRGGFSYYSGTRAAHIDLVAYATATKWGALSPAVRKKLISQGRRTLATVIRDSPVEVLVLNGRSVVNEFVASAEVQLRAAAVEGWTLPRAAGLGVAGFRYSGAVSSIAGIDLERAVRVVGFNHNLQSSFGVTTSVMHRIGQDVGETVASARHHSTQ